MQFSKKILVGNAFPLSLIRREVKIVPIPAEAFPRECEILSFWGHINSLAGVNAWLGRDLTPKTERPALSLSEDFYPMLDGEIFNECYVISPNFTEAFRSAHSGTEVAAEKIVSYVILKLIWN